VKFLTAEWRWLAMVNWEVDARIVERLIPRGTEVDFHEGKTYLSLVGFLFRDTRVWGVPVPFHRDFEEVNLRYYVRRGERRAVGFVREIVPKAAVTAMARAFYNENYVTMPMGHTIEPELVEYRFGDGNWIRARYSGDPVGLSGEAEFIAEHYWGYARQADGGTVEYQVEHPPWRVWPQAAVEYQCDFGVVYGPEWADLLQGKPASAFLAEGSEIAVYHGTRVA
jgi:hypothetical protein